MPTPRTQPVLNERPLAVLRWVGEGSPNGVFEGDAFKISAAALRNRGLIRTSGHGPSWRAVLTPTGHARLASDVIDLPEPPPAPPLPPSLPRTRRTPPRRPTPSTSKSAGLIAAVLAGDGRFTAEDPSWEEEARLRRLVNFANQRPERPRGKRLVLERDNDRHLVVVLADAIPVTEVELIHFMVPERVRELHSVAARFRDQKERHEVSCELLRRAVRIVHALVGEGVRRGYTIAIPRGEITRRRDEGWSAERDGHLSFESEDAVHHIRIREKGVVLRGTWQLEHDWRREHARWGSLSRQPHPRTYDADGDRRLMLILGSGYRREGRPSSWADRQSWALEEKLPELFREMAVRDAEAHHRRREEERRAAERRRRWEQAVERAKARYLEDFRGGHLRREMESAAEAEAIRGHCDRLEAAAKERGGPSAEEDEWLAWARGHSEEIDPRHRPFGMPPDPKIGPEDLRPYLDGLSPDGPDGW